MHSATIAIYSSKRDATCGPLIEAQLDDGRRRRREESDSSSNRHQIVSPRLLPMSNKHSRKLDYPILLENALNGYLLAADREHMESTESQVSKAGCSQYGDMR